jgi:hypothetical protein
MVLGGDLNLAYDESPDVRSCLPSGHPRFDHGEVQRVVAATDFTVLVVLTIVRAVSTEISGMMPPCLILTHRAGRFRPSCWRKRPRYGG